MSDKDELEERLAEVEAENNAIKEYLAKLVENGPSRRQVLKSGATAAGAGMLGFSAGNASAQASENDSDGNVGTPDNRIDVFGDGGDYNVVTTGEQNGNEINLTRLVNDGTYANIADAIANEPPTNPTGTRHIIEPGTYGPISGQYSIDYSNREIVAYGFGDVWNQTTGSQTLPVEIVQDDAETGPMFTVPDGGEQYNGVRFAGIDFKPETGGGGHSAFLFDASSSGGLNRAWDFYCCSVRQFGGPGIDTTDPTQNYDMNFVRCRFQKNRQQTYLGKQTTLDRCYVLSQNDSSGNPGMKIDFKSAVKGGILAGATGTDYGIQVRSPSRILPKNAEGSGSPSGNAAIRVEGANAGPSQIGGQFDNWDTAVEVQSGPIVSPAAAVNFGNVNTAFDFQGGNNSHNGTYISGNIPPGKVNFASTTQSQVLIVSSAIMTSSGTAPDPFTLIFHSDVDGAGTPGLAYGGSTLVPARYWTGTAF